MRRHEQTDVGMLGATGLVSERFLASFADPKSLFKLAFVIPGSEESQARNVGLRLENSDIPHPSNLDNVPVISPEQALDSDVPALVSSPRNEVAEAWERPLAEGRVLATNAEPNRRQPDTAMMNIYTNPKVYEELYELNPDGKIVAGGNCMAIINSVVMAPIMKKLGITSVDVETYQGWSGKGLREVPDDELGMISDIGIHEESKIEAEPAYLLGGMRERPKIDISAHATRGSWVYGHHARLELTFENPTSKGRLKSMLREFRKPEEINRVKYGALRPRRHPIQLEAKSLLVPDDEAFNVPRYALMPMRVQARVSKFDREQPNKATIEVFGDNLALGAAGSSLANLALLKLVGKFD